jgi:hypothetical protein
MGAFRLLARVREALGPDSVEGPWEVSTSGSRSETGMAGIGISPSKHGIGEIKLSRSYIQMKYEILWKQQKLKYTGCLTGLLSVPM